ncbi:MAG: four helix bundle protein [Candidatus Zambryskibacteria bacterium]|nr:four helix bundle protein [Candidatus Zambryskibacteria bacterium]
MKTYKDLLVWKRSIELATKIYKITEKFPKEEVYGIISQMRRSVVSISSNIAEGRNKGTRRDFVQFLRIALGSTAELESQIEISKNLKFIKIEEYSQLISETSEIGMMLRAIIRKLNLNSKLSA